MSNIDYTPWYLRDVLLSPFDIFYVLPPSMLAHQARERILGLWNLKNLYVDEHKESVSFGCELMMIDPEYIVAKKYREEIPSKARDLLIHYSVLDKDSLPLDDKQNSYVLIKILLLSKHVFDTEYIDVSKEGKIANIKKRWVRP